MDNSNRNHPQSQQSKKRSARDQGYQNEDLMNTPNKADLEDMIDRVILQKQSAEKQVIRILFFSPGNKWKFILNDVESWIPASAEKVFAFKPKPAVATCQQAKRQKHLRQHHPVPRVHEHPQADSKLLAPN